MFLGPSSIHPTSRRFLWCLIGQYHITWLCLNQPIGKGRKWLGSIYTSQVSHPSWKRFSESHGCSEEGPLRKKLRKQKGSMTAEKAATGSPSSLTALSPSSPTLESTSWQAGLLGSPPCLQLSYESCYMHVLQHEVALKCLFSLNWFGYLDGKLKY